MNPENLVMQETYRPLDMQSQSRIWEITGELVDFQQFVWFNKKTRTWDRFGPESVFSLYDDGHVEVDR